MTTTNTVIVGASISGLSVAACLQKKNIDHIIIEKGSCFASPWHHHYERLHLHTSKQFSNLPFKKFGDAVPRYPSKQDVLDYINEYAKQFTIQPLFNTEAINIKQLDDGWVTETSNGTYYSKHIVMATGAYGQPKPIDIKGMESFEGRLLHSSAYKTGKDFINQKVLVIGFGNSACEIAIDLFEQGAIPYMSVRSAVNVIPRDIFGIPVLSISKLLQPLPPSIADALIAPVIRLLIGDLSKLGLQKLPYGPLQQIRKYGKVPVLDIGTMQHIGQQHIKVYGGIDRIEGSTVFFIDGVQQQFDAIIAAIGYERNYTGILQVDKSRFHDLRLPAGKQKYFGKDGLYFCGYWISPTGQFNEIAADAKRIANDIGMY